MNDQREKNGSWKRWAAAAGLTAVGVLAVTLTGLFLLRDKSAVYEEIQVARGPLSVGITKEGSVSVGTTEQTFALNISQLLEASGSDTSQSGQTGTAADGQTVQTFAGGQTGTPFSTGLFDVGSLLQQETSGRRLTVETVYVSAGEEVAAGDAVLKLTEESVEKIRQSLEEDADSAQILYEEQQVSYAQTEQSAQSDLDLNLLYGTYAAGAYISEVNTLQEAVEETEKEKEELTETAQETEAELAALQEQLALQEEVAQNASYTVENSSREDSLYWWLVALASRTQAEESLENLRAQIEACETQREENDAALESAERTLAEKQEALESGTAQAEADRQIRSLRAQNAQEVYDVTVELAAFEKDEAQETSEEASEQLSEFDDYLKGGEIHASSSGIITEVSVEAGDTIGEEGDALIGLNDYDEVTVVLTVEESVVREAPAGTPVSLSFPAFADETFDGEVEEVGDAQMDSSTNSTTYEVVVSVNGSGSRFYEGMSAEVTFLTQQTKEVLYVPKQAVSTQGEKSWVLVKTADGKSEKRQVATGFSDGVSVEIQEGLEEGETVLTESGGKSA